MPKPKMIQSCQTSTKEHATVNVGLRVTPYNWNLRRARKAASLTQAKLATLAGISFTAYNALECLRTPAHEEIANKIADALGCDPLDLFPPATRNFRSCKSRSVEFLARVESLDALPDADLIGVNILPSPAETVESGQLAEAIREALDTVSPVCQKVLKLRFGFHDGHSYTLDEVGKKLGCNRERIRQIEARGLRELRHPSRLRLLKDWKDG